MSATLPEPVELTANALAMLWRHRPLALRLSRLLNWPWVTIVLLMGTVWFRRDLPHISMAYVFGGVAIAVTVSGVGAPLLSMMAPGEAFAAMFSLRSVKSSVFRAGAYPEEYLDHPEVDKAFQAAGDKPAEQAQRVLMNRARRTFETGLLALLVLPWVRHNHLGEWLALGMPVSFSISTVVQQELIQLTRWISTIGKEHGF